MDNDSRANGNASTAEFRGCDTSEMVVIHRMFRQQFSHAPQLVREVLSGDTGRSMIVGGHIAEFASALRHHHATEDERLWDTLESRSPACALHVSQMKAQHADVAALLDKLDAQLSQWQESADPGSRGGGCWNSRRGQCQACPASRPGRGQDAPCRINDNEPTRMEQVPSPRTGECSEKPVDGPTRVYPQPVGARGTDSLDEARPARYRAPALPLGWPPPIRSGLSPRLWNGSRLVPRQATFA